MHALKKPAFEKKEIIMKNLICFLMLFTSFVLQAPSSASVVKFQVDPDRQYDEIEPIWDILNLWAPSFILDNSGHPNTWLRDTQPFLNRIILMTATGGRPDYPQLEILKKDSLGNLVYDFSNFDSYLDATLFNHFTPIIVLGAIPFVLAPEHYHIGVFGSITDPPTDYMQWYRFVKTLISHCVEKYGADEMKSWQWRLYTEPDNRDWWSGTKEEYFKLYDYTAAAALEAMPGIIIGPGNMLGEMEDHWGIQFLDHAFAGTNYFSGKTGSYFKFFTISAYERCVKNFPPMKQFKSRIAAIKDKLRHYGALDTIALGFDEGQLITDENGVYLWLGDGTEYGASWQAAYQVFGIRHGLSRIVQWGFTSDGVKTPKYNVIEMLEKMKGQTRVDMQKVVDTRSIAALFIHQFDGIASIAKDKSSVKVLVYSHNKYRHPQVNYIENPQPVQITVRDLPFRTSTVHLTHWVVDSTHSNFFNIWLEESKDLARVPAGGTGGSIYDAGVTSNFNQDGHVFWWYHKPAYLEIDDLQKMGADRELEIEGDSLTIEIAMTPHQVSLLELMPGSQTGVRSTRGTSVGVKQEFRIFPNPFNSSTTIYLNKVTIAGEIDIFNVTGRLIKSFRMTTNDVGKSFTVTWRGENNSGESVASGLYFIFFNNGKRTMVQRALLLR